MIELMGLQEVSDPVTIKTYLKSLLAHRINYTPPTYNGVSHQFFLEGDPSQIHPIRHDLLKYPAYLRRGSSDIHNFGQIFYNKEYSFVLEYKKPIEYIIDLGGYIGLSSILFANLFPQAKIILVEPDVDNFTIAQLNCRHYKNITCLNNAIWSHSCTLSLSRSPIGKWSNGYEPCSNYDSGDKLGAPKAITIDYLIEHFSIPRIDFLKIDIEGSEKELFSSPSYKSWLQTVGLLSCELHDHFVPGCSESVKKAVKDFNFTSHKCGEYEYFISA